jgi:hypothetical protein
MTTSLSNATTTRCPACYEQIVSEDLADHLQGFHGWGQSLIAALVAAGAAPPLDVRALATRVRGQLTAALGAAQLAEHHAVVWSDLIGRHYERVEIAYRGGPTVPDHLWQARDHEAAQILGAELRSLVEAAHQTLSAWEVGLDEAGAPRRQRPDPENEEG